MKTLRWFLLLSWMLCHPLLAQGTVVVTTNLDDVPGSLRDAVFRAESGSTIVFDPLVFTDPIKNTIKLTSQLAIPNKILTIDASGVNGVTLDGRGENRVLVNLSGGGMTLDSVSLTGGDVVPGSGSGFINGGLAILNNCAIYRNYTSGCGGGVLNLNSGRLTMTNCTIFENTAGRGGGGIENNGLEAEVTLINCTVARNKALDLYPGGIGASGGVVHLENCVVALNESIMNPDIFQTSGGNYTTAGKNFIGINEGAEGAFPADSVDASLRLIGSRTAPLEPGLVGDSGSGDSLVINGGPTRSIMPLPDSPLIDNGETTDQTPMTDQRGFSRVNRPSGDLEIDIGAVEATWDIGLTADLPANPGGDLLHEYNPMSLFHESIASTFFGAYDNSQMTTQLSDVSLNNGLTFSPLIGLSSLTGLTLTVPSNSSGGLGPGNDPQLFMIYGSNDLNRFELLMSGTIPDLVRGETWRVSRETPSEFFRHYRVVFPTTRWNFPLALSEMEVWAVPKEPQLRMLKVISSNAGRGQRDIRYWWLSIPNSDYGIQNSDDPESESWTQTQIYRSNNDLISMLRFIDPPGRTRYHRVIELPEE